MKDLTGYKAQGTPKGQVSIEMQFEKRGDDERMSEDEEEEDQGHSMDVDMGIPERRLGLKRVHSTSEQQTSGKRQRVMVHRLASPPRDESVEGDRIEVDMTGYRRVLLPGRDEEVFGQVWATDRHVLVKDKNPGTIYVVVLDWSRESMLRLHKASANEHETLGTEQEILKKGFFIAMPEKNDFIVWRSKYGSGEEKDDYIKSWSMKDHSEEHLSVMDNIQSDLYGPVEDEYEGPGGIAIETLCDLKPVKGSKRAYILGVSNQSQRNLEGPAHNSKQLGRSLDKGGELQKRLLACSVKGNVVGLSKVDSSLTRHLDNQAELTNCARIGSIDNRYWTGAQLNVGSLEREPGNVDKGKGSGKDGDKDKGRTLNIDGNIKDIGQFGGPHEDDPTNTWRLNTLQYTMLELAGDWTSIAQSTFQAFITTVVQQQSQSRRSTLKQ
ncbi:hypothetical protein GGU11DRAFT_750335 [Lentinula aff. detonsa]|nr:hypothetical protein GGU11DRAFT_750335 [Lentinula aff. detonsa]